MPKTFIATQIPRAIRQKRLWFIKINAVIGELQLETSYAGPEYYDLMMFTPRQFEMAKMYLAYQTPGMPSLERDDESPPYIPQHIREVNVPDDVPEPEAYAKAHFRKEWKLDKNAA